MGELVKQGQEDGTIRSAMSSHRTDLEDPVQRVVPGPAEVVGVSHRSELVPIYAMAGATPEQFDQVAAWSCGS